MINGEQIPDVEEIHVIEKNNSFYASVFKWLALGLLITFASGYLLCFQYPELMIKIFSSRLYALIFVIELIIVIFFRASLTKFSFTVSVVSYALYSLFTGITFSVLFAMFEGSSILSIFLVSAAVFGAMGFIGTKLKMKLNSFGTFLFVGLISLLILELINLFILGGTLNMFLCVIGLVIFIGYIMFDFNRINIYAEQGGTDNRLALSFAFELYIDFINVFIKLLQLFGRRRN